jgi:NADPH:quinone reductase-like Zn-dependent oxidoreductase
MKIPSNISFEEAATLGVSISTVGQGLYQSLGLPLPEKQASQPVLIYGGATGTGLFAIQFAKLNGCTVVTTCSPKNFELVKSFGADAAFDYKDADKCAKEIKDFTKGELRLAFDCISEGTSPKICAEAIGEKGGQYSSLLPVKELPRSDVSNKSTLAYTILNEDFKFAGNPIPASKEDFEFAKTFWALTEKLMSEKKIRVPPIVKNEGGKGLEGVMKGLDYFRQGKVSGHKLVYDIAA